MPQSLEQIFSITKSKYTAAKTVHILIAFRRLTDKSHINKVIDVVLSLNSDNSEEKIHLLTALCSYVLNI